jgi:hypothetical protein
VPVAAVTWYQDVAPILATHCMSCHQPGGIGPFSLTEYDDAAPIAHMLTDAIDSGVMPPFSEATSADCAPTHAWKGDPRLSTAERATLQAWIDGGGAAGIPAAIAVPAIPDLPGKTHSLTANPYTTSGTQDQFMCFLLDPQTTAPTWLTGWQVRPGNATVVHHAVLSTLPASLMDAARGAFGVGTAFDCSAAAAVPGSVIVGAWAPGGDPFDSPDAGEALGAGDGIILQIHYHPAGGVAVDATTIDLRLSPTAPPHEFALHGFGNAHGAPQLQPGPDDPPTGPKFLIPANATGHTETMLFPVNDLHPIAIMTAFPHMHFVGTDLMIKVHHADQSQECLTNISKWSFDWQRQYAVDAPIDQLPVVYPGDTIEIRCTYDNTLDNPYVLRSLHDQGLSAPVDVTLGEQTTNEMCLTLFSVIPLN